MKLITFNAKRFRYLVTVNPFPSRISSSRKMRKLTENKSLAERERERETERKTGKHCTHVLHATYYTHRAS
ncbi:UNVERIFIED_CONTAM: hypothetical protein FKN15_076274 [Acipenser sinensis]